MTVLPVGERIRRTEPDTLQQEFPHVTMHDLGSDQGQVSFIQSLKALPTQLKLEPWQSEEPKEMIQEAVNRGIVVLNARPQLDELIEVRYPGKYPKEEDGQPNARLTGVLDRVDGIGGGNMAERSYRVQGRFVQTLSRKDFLQVYTSRNLPVVSAETQAMLEEIEVAIAGLSVGGGAADILTAAGVLKFTMADPDTLSLSNFGRFPVADIGQIGVTKARVLAMAMLDRNPYVQIDAHEKLVGLETDAKHVSIQELLKDAFVLVEAIDKLDLKVFFHQAAQKAGIPSLMASDLGLTAAALTLNTPDKPLFDGRIAQADIDFLRDNPKLTPQQFMQYAVKIVGPQNIPPEFGAALGKTPWLPQPAAAAHLSSVLVDTVITMLAAGESVKPEMMINVRAAASQ